MKTGYLDLSGKSHVTQLLLLGQRRAASRSSCLYFIAGAGTVLPKLSLWLEPASPTVTYDVDIDFFCRLVEFAVGVASLVWPAG